MLNDESGKIIFNIIDGLDNKQVLAREPYYYYLYRLTQGEILKLTQLASFSIYVLSANNWKALVVKENGIALNQGDMVQVENSEVTLEIAAPMVELLVAGITESYTKDRIIKIVREKDIYKVTKPWGYELWINGEHPGYVLKKVSIKAGTRTSLQYHRYKHETNVIFSGEANIHYKNKIEIPNDEVGLDDVGTTKVSPITSVYVSPNTIHRVEALTDIVLYETSTPHLDDVIRVQDDTARSNGRISSEHGATS